jgi:hypothetical protein
MTHAFDDFDYWCLDYLPRPRGELHSSLGAGAYIGRIFLDYYHYYYLRRAGEEERVAKLSTGTQDGRTRRTREIPL